MSLVICPGIHDRALTQSFTRGLLAASETLPSMSLLVFPAEQYPAYSGLHILHFLHEQLSCRHPDRTLNTPLVFIGFSAGVVGAMGAAWGWQASGGTVRALIAIDGWGVPLVGTFPLHRLSHDSFTHWSSAVLGAGEDSFYADPGVTHLELWRSPQTATGWWHLSKAATAPIATTAANFLTALLHRYEGQ